MSAAPPVAVAPPAAPSVVDRLVALQHEAEALEALLERLSASGHIGLTRPAGDARVAILAAAAALEPGDLCFGTARDLPAALARGVALDTILRQAWGVDGDPGLGRGLPGALCSAEHGLTLTDGNVASHLVHAAGFGHAARLRREPRVALGLAGSAAQQNGEVHAAFNFAAVYDAHAVFVLHGPLGDELPFEEAAVAWGIQTVAARGDDGCAVHGAVRDARARAIAGGGPTVVDARLTGPAEPVDVRALREAGRFLPEQQHALEDAVRDRLLAARRAAEAAAAVDPGTLTDHVVAGDGA